jgi:glycosyltransferase involved in cell wall biosynthesis
VHNDPVAVTTDVCDRYFCLTRAEIHKRGPLRFLERGAVGATAAAPPSVTSKSIVGRLARFGKSMLFGNALPDVGELTPELESWVASFRPQVIYTILGSNAMMDLALALHRRFGAALVVHMMDDWPAVAYRGGAFSGLSRGRMRRLLRELFRSASARMCICDEMAREYERRYGAAFLSFQNPVDTKRWQATAKTDLRVQGTARILYIGSVLPDAQLDSLVDCCHAVRTLRQQHVDVVFDIYSPFFQTQPFRNRLCIDPAIRLHDAIADDEGVFRLLGEADILLLPVNFDVQTVRYIRLSMPTKVPAYLSSGTPVLVYGPPDIAQVRYAQAAGWGFVVSQRGSLVLAEGIRRLASDTGLRERLSHAARGAALAHHDATSVRARFQASVCDAGSPGMGESKRPSAAPSGGMRACG